MNSSKIKYLIVLDSFEYKDIESNLSSNLNDLIDPIFFYSKYENKITEFFQRTKYIGGILTHITYWLLSVTYALKLFNHKFDKVENIIFINPIVGIFYCLFLRLFHIKKIVSIGGFLFENKQNGLYLYLRKRFVNYSYKDVKYIYVYGLKEIEYYSYIFPKLKDKFKYIKYGKDFLYKKKKDFKFNKPYIASGGRSNRDFDTLCEAIQLIKTDGKEIPTCIIATRPEAVTQKMINSPVNIQYGITLNQFGSFIEHSQIFIIPLLNTEISAGHMVMMEVMAHEIPIIVTDIPAIRNYVTHEHVTFYKPNDVKDLYEKILFVLENLRSECITTKIKKAKELYTQEFSFNSLLRRIVQQSLN